MTGTTGRRRLPAPTFANLQIPDAPLNKQLEIEGKVKELKEMAKRLEEKANRIVAETKIEVERIILGGQSYAESLLPLRLFKCRQGFWLVVPGLRDDTPQSIA